MRGQKTCGRQKGGRNKTEQLTKTAAKASPGFGGTMSWPGCIGPLLIGDDQRVIGVVRRGDRRELRMHVVGRICSALLGNLALARDFAHQLQPGPKLLWRQIAELLFKLFGPLMRNPHVLSSITSRG
jgi:hypothetical protein